MSSGALKGLSTVSGYYSTWAMVSLAAFMCNAATHIPLLRYVLPYTIDQQLEHTPEAAKAQQAAVHNLLLLALFIGHHSLMLRPWFKDALKRIIPAVFIAPLYQLLSGLFLHILLAGWVPMGSFVWKIDSASPLFLAIYVVRLAAFASCMASVRSLSNEEIQLTQARKGNAAAPPKKELRLQFPYNVVRHPAMSMLLVATWSTPCMSMGHLLLSTVFTLYVVLAVLLLEEPDLVKEFGDQYRQYQKRVPAFVPFRGVITKLD